MIEQQVSLTTKPYFLSLKWNSCLALATVKLRAVSGEARKMLWLSVGRRAPDRWISRVGNLTPSSWAMKMAFAYGFADL